MNSKRLLNAYLSIFEYISHNLLLLNLAYTKDDTYHYRQAVHPKNKLERADGDILNEEKTVAWHSSSGYILYDWLLKTNPNAISSYIWYNTKMLQIWEKRE